MPTERPRIFVAVTPSLYELLCTPDTDAQLRSLGDVTYQQTEEWSAESQKAALAETDIVMTSWGAKRFDAEMVAAAPDLKFIAHAAGSVRGLCPSPVWDRGIRVMSAAPAIAPAVAELSLSLTMIALRQGIEAVSNVRRGDWHHDILGKEIAGARVGVVGAGGTGRAFIKLLNAVNAEVLVYDPYISEEGTAALNATKCDLEKMFATCDAVSLQAPVTEETKGMITAELLEAMPDGASFINTARGSLVDQDALLAELKTGRINAALDVSAPEPLPMDHELRQLPNVILTPHMGGRSIDARRRQGAAAVADIARFIADQPLRYEVTREQLAILA